MKIKLGILILVCLLQITNSYSQTFSISGRVFDQADTIPVIGGIVQLISREDSTKKTGTATNNDGNFIFNSIQPGLYKIKINYIGSRGYEKDIAIVDADVHLGSVILKAGRNVLGNVVVQGEAAKSQQSGDTTQFNANAYKTNPDANAEDLITKMPGVTSDNNGLKVNGEDVKQVLVDGKPFFGDDPNAAIKNLPAEVIDKIQVFDKLSDQAQFTGFDDGNSQKAINIITKRGKNNGQFGKLYAGYGTDDRYSAGGSINLFDGDRRVSILGMSNNINQQNFSTEDLLGVTSGNSSRGRGGFGGGGGRGNNGGGYRGGSDAGNFLVGQQNGITTTHSAGINYSDNWGKKIKISGSYFFNYTNNKNQTDLVRNYFTEADSGLVYTENSSTESKNMNHRASLRFEYTIDSFNSIFITPRLSYQDNDYTTSLLGGSRVGDALVSGISNDNNSNNHGYNFSNNMLYQHRFAKRGRTISLNIGTQLNDKAGDGKIYSLNQYINTDTTLLDEHYDLGNNGYTLSGNISYTEPIGKKGQLLINYSPSYSKNKSDKETYDFNNSEHQYVDFNSLLSNKYDNTYNTQRGGANYRFNDRKTNFMLGANMQYATLDGRQTFPYTFNLNKNFTSILPQAMFNYKFDQFTNLRMMYRTATNAPSTTQLQNVVDITNPLLLRTGNPDLKQDYQHTVILRYGKTKTTKGRSFFIFGYANYAANYIGNATYIPEADSIIVDGIIVRNGSQLSRPVNLHGYWNARSFATLGLPLNIIKSNLNLNAGFSYGHTPALINSIINYSNSYTPNAGVVISSNISEKIDFTISYTGNYNVVRNTVQAQTDNSYYSHVAAFKINWMPWKGLVLNTNLTETKYFGLTESYNQRFLLWNAYVGYKFLKSRALEARISAFDILNQNKNISRNVTDVYTEDTRTQVLTQYFMFSLTYTIRNFKGMAEPKAEDNEQENFHHSGGFRNRGESR